MALVSPGPIGIISGRIGGAEFAVQGGKSIMKQAKTRHSRNSPSKMRAQAFHKTSIARWQGLAPANQQAWKIAAETRPRPDRFGNMRNISAFQLFLSLQHDFNYNAQLWQDLPPVENVPLALDYAVTIHPGPELNVTASNWFTIPIFPFSWIYISRMRPANSKARSYTWKVLGPTYTANNTESWIAVLTAENISFILGEHVHIKASFGGIGYWPFTMDFGINEVVAP